MNAEDSTPHTDLAPEIVPITILGSISGIVLNRLDGSPVDDAIVEVRRGKYLSLGVQTVSERGGFLIEQIELGEYFVRAARPFGNTNNAKWVQLTPSVPNASVTLIIPHGYTISGIVLDEHEKPIESVVVTAKYRGHLSESFVTSKDTSIRTDQYGRFELEGLLRTQGSDGFEIPSYKVEFDHADYFKEFRRIHVLEGVNPTPVSVVLRRKPPPTTITGRIVGPNNVPIAGQDLSLHRITLLEGEGFIVITPHAKTNCQGEFFFSLVRESSDEIFLLDVIHPRYAAERYELRVVAGDVEDLGEIQLSEGVLTSGIVTNLSGLPAIHATVVCRSHTDTPKPVEKTVKLDGYGRFSVNSSTGEELQITALPPDDWVLCTKSIEGSNRIRIQAPKASIKLRIRGHPKNMKCSECGSPDR